MSPLSRIAAIDGLARGLRQAGAVMMAIGAWILLAHSGIGCTNALDKARIATTAAADVGTATARFVGDYSEQCEAAATKLATVEHDVPRAREASAKCKHDFEIMDKAVRTYAVGVSGVRAGIELSTVTKKFDLGVVLRELLQLGRALKGALEAYGVQMPGGLLL